MSWLDLAVRVVPDSLLQRAKGLQETLRFEQVEKERQARLAEEIKRRRSRGVSAGGGEGQTRQRINQVDTIFGRRGPNKIIIRRPIGNGGVGFGDDIAMGLLAQSDGVGFSDYTLSALNDESATVRIESQTVQPAVLSWDTTGFNYAQANGPPPETPGETYSGTYTIIETQTPEEEGTRTSEVYRQFSIVNYAYNDQHVFVMPHRPDTMVVAILRRQALSSNYIRIDQTKVEVVTKTAGPYTIDDLPAEYYDYSISVSMTQTTTSLDDQLFRGWGVAVFYVTPATVREISAPVGLLSSLERLYPPHIAVGGTRTIGGLYEHSDGSFTASELGITTFAPDLADAPGVEGEDPITFETIPHYLLKSYGLGNFASEITTPTRHDEIGTDQYGTPAVYDYLQSFNGGLDYADAISYPAARLTFTTSPPPRVVGKCVFNGQCDLDATDWSMSEDVPSSLLSPLAVASFQQFVSKVGIEGFDNVMVAGWNWGNTGYCNSRLESLGFTSADLSP